jgi:hypothetical protein
MWQQFGSDLEPDSKWQFGAVAIPSITCLLAYQNSQNLPPAVENALVILVEQLYVGGFSLKINHY